MQKPGSGSDSYMASYLIDILFFFLEVNLGADESVREVGKRLPKSDRLLLALHLVVPLLMLR